MHDTCTLGSKLEGDGNWHGGNQGDMCFHGILIVILGVTSDIFKINLLIKKIMCFQSTR